MLRISVKKKKVERWQKKKKKVRPANAEVTKGVGSKHSAFGTRVYCP